MRCHRMTVNCHVSDTRGMLHSGAETGFGLALVRPDPRRLAPSSAVVNVCCTIIEGFLELLDAYMHGHEIRVVECTHQLTCAS
jgi:hypothetical protein